MQAWFEKAVKSLGSIAFALEDGNKPVSLIAGSGDVLTPLWCHESTLLLLTGCAIFWHFPCLLVSAA